MHIVALPIPDDFADDQGRISGDIECRRCGYNLRGLPLDGRCPECQRTVDFTVRGDLLRFRDPAWLARMQRGARVLLAWMVSVVLLALSANLVMWTERSAAIVIWTLVFGALSVVYLCGVWLVTTPEPGPIGERDLPDLRAAARWGAVITTVAKLLLLPVNDVFARDALGVHLPPGLGDLITVTDGVATLASHGAVFALLMYASRLVLRIPDDRLARRTRTVAWGLLASLALTTVLGLAMRLHAPAIKAAPLLLAGGFALVVFAMATVLLLFAHLRRLAMITAMAAR